MSNRKQRDKNRQTDGNLSLGIVSVGVKGKWRKTEDESLGWLVSRTNNTGYLYRCTSEPAADYLLPTLNGVVISKECAESLMTLIALWDGAIKSRTQVELRQAIRESEQ